MKWRKRVIALRLLLFLMIVCIEATGSIRDLHVDETLRLETIRSGDTNYYRLIGVRPSEIYELKVSYPAYNPAEFRLEVTTNEAESGRPSGSRQLLDIEKLVLHTNESGSLILTAVSDASGRNPIVAVTAQSTAVRPLYNTADALIRYDIALDSTYMGAPKIVVKLGVCVLIAAGLAIVVVLPQLLTSLRRVPKRKEL